MKKSELKNILKPLVKECINEVMFEDGVLSGIISEVARGMGTAPVETVSPTPDRTKERMKRNAFSQEQTGKLQEHKKKLMSAIGGQSFNGVDLFEGTTPAPAQGPSTQTASPLSNQPPDDAGVDISNLFGAVGRKWNAHMNEVKEGK